jgi:hypothetical protein
VGAAAAQNFLSAVRSLMATSLRRIDACLIAPQVMRLQGQGLAGARATGAAFGGDALKDAQLRS